MTPREQVICLRELDRALDALRERIATAGSSSRARERLSDSRQKLEALRAEQLSTASAVTAHEAASRALDERLKVLHRRIYGGGEPPFLIVSLQEEYARLVAQRDDLDERLLGELERQERLERGLPSLEAAVREHEADLEQAQLDDAKQQESLRARLAEQEMARQGLLDGLERETRVDYERMRSTVGDPTAQMRRAACTGCRMGLSDVIFRKFRLGELVRCPTCGRFLLEHQS